MNLEFLEELAIRVNWQRESKLLMFPFVIKNRRYIRSFCNKSFYTNIFENETRILIKIIHCISTRIGVSLSKKMITFS